MKKYDIIDPNDDSFIPNFLSKINSEKPEYGIYMRNKKANSFILYKSFTYDDIIRGANEKDNIYLINSNKYVITSCEIFNYNIKMLYCKKDLITKIKRLFNKIKDFKDKKELSKINWFDKNK